MPSLARLLARQSNFDNDDDRFDDEEESFWWSEEGVIMKYCVLLFIFLFFFGWIIGGYIHAQRRMRKGLPPLAYQRWLVSRSQRARFDPHYQNQFSFYQNQGYNNGRHGDGQQYNMHPYSEPPPMYAHDAPPAYQPPPGATKANPQQTMQPQQPDAGSSSAPPQMPEQTEPQLPPRTVAPPQNRSWAQKLLRRN